MTCSSCSCLGATPRLAAAPLPLSTVSEQNDPLCLALGVVLSGSSDVYSKSFQVMPGNSAVLTVTMINNDGFGEVRAEFQGAGGIGGTFQTTGPAALAVTFPGETKGLVLAPTGFPVLRVRFYSPTSNVGVINAAVRAFRV
jgi:hypothetical protein